MLPQANPTVIFKLMADGAVLFAPSTEIYFGLNEVGARIWQLLPEAGGSIDALCDRLAEQYPEVPRETLLADVQELLDSLVAEGLATLPGASGADAGAGAS
jgi:hypothetical protein